MDNEDLASLIAGDDTAAAPEAAAEAVMVPEAPAAVAPEPAPPSPPPPPPPPPPPEPAQAPAPRAVEAPMAPEERREAELWALRRDMSRELLASRLGEDEAKALEAWGFAACERDPVFNAQVYQARNPYEFIRQARQREQVLAAVKPEDLEDFRAWKSSLARQGAGGPAPPAPPRSLVTAPNAGGAGAQAEIPVGPGAAFASTIRR